MSDCPTTHHECAGTARIARIAEAMGIQMTARHYRESDFEDDGETFPGEMVYEARNRVMRRAIDDRLRVVTLDAAMVEGDAACDEVIAMELEHLRC